MDFSALIKKSFYIAWHNRVLWIFGFLSGGAGGVGYFNFTGGSGNIGPSDFSPPAEPSREQIGLVGKVLGATDRATEPFFNSLSPETWILLILTISLIVLITVLLIIFVTSWAAAALVYSILKREEVRPTFWAGARAGLKYWWKYWLLTLTLGLFILVFFLMLATPALLLFLADLKPLALAYTVLAAALFILSLFVITVVGSLIVTLSQRMIIHKGTGILESIRLSGGLVRKYKGESFLTWLVAVGLNIAAGMAFFLVFIPIILVLAALFFLGYLLADVWLGVVTAGIAAIPILILLFAVGGFWNAFAASYWTLFYEHLASKEGW